METNQKQAIINFFSKHTRLSSQGMQDLESRLSFSVLKRKDHLLKMGEVCRFNSFMVKGCVRTFKICRAGKEHNISFASENTWFTSFKSFIFQNPSEYYMEALEQSLLCQIKKSDWDYLTDTYPEISQAFRRILEKWYLNYENRVFQNISMTARERYLQFLSDYPNLVGRIPDAHIASYLGITPEFLSKIRSKLSQYPSARIA